MQRGFFVAGNANQMAQNKLNDISHNLANGNTVGFMGHRTAFSTIFTSANNRVATPDQTPAGYLSLNRQFTDTGKGILTTTGNQLDFAIQGDAYFRVRTSDGTEALTRAGNFIVDGDGKLMTQSGHAVLDDSGQPINVPMGALSVTRNGTLYVNIDGSADATAVGTLGIAALKDSSKISLREGVLLLTPKDNIAEAPTDINVRQGTLEESNVNSILGMTELIGVMRSSESMMKVVEIYNQQASLLNDRVGLVQG